MNSEFAQLKSHLQPGERLIWSGRPDPRVIFNSKDLVIVPVSAVACAGLIAWLLAIVREQGPTTAVLPGAIALLIALYLLGGRLVSKYLDKKRTVYALTESRAIVLRGERSLRELPIDGESFEIAMNGHHLSVRFGSADLALTSNFLNPDLFANTGLDFLTRGTLMVRFFDVADVTGLSQVLAELRQH